MSSLSLPAAPPIGVADAPTRVASGRRMVAIDALRGFVMLCMLVDHVRETFFLHRQVTDPMNILTIAPSLYLTRMASEICAPVFILLTGLSAWLYGQSHTRSQVSSFLLKRGFFLIALELTVVCFGWTAQLPPSVLWLQVIWCIGLCMIALAALLHLPRLVQIVLAALIVLGHNLLDTVVVAPDSALFPFWAILHQRAYLPFVDGIRVHVSYPVLPWIGVILAGYLLGPLFGWQADPVRRNRVLIAIGIGLTAAFLVIRSINVYGEQPWIHTGDSVRTVMSFFSATKYPPSLMFLLPTTGLGLLLMAGFERIEASRSAETLAVLGGAPMFFYLLHIYVLKALYLAALAIWGANHGRFFGFDHVWALWLCVPVLAVPLFFPTRWFAQLKQRRRDIWWLKYL